MDGFHNPVAFFPADALLGDVNANGILDILSVNWHSNNISVLRDNGTAGSFQEPIMFPAGPRPFPGLLRDFTNDGVLDVVVSNYIADGTVSFLPGAWDVPGIGNGQFFPLQTYPLNFPWAQYLAAGDFDGDGFMDVAVAGPYGPVSILLNNGVGGFLGPTQIAILGSSPSQLAAAHINEDTIIDLLIATREGRVYALSGNATGVFSAPALVASVSGSYFFGIDTGDVDNDGDAERL